MKNIFGQFPGGRYLGKEEIQNVSEVIKSRSPYRFSGLNLKMYCNKLEKSLANFVSKKYALVVNSGTAALHCGLHAIGVKPGDEVIVPAYGWSADLMSIINVGAVPVIAPVSADVNLDLKKVKNLVTKKTKALIVIHMRGYPCNFTNIVSFFKKKNIPIIEDCSQCFGGFLPNKKRVGSLGDISIMSLQYNKMITSGEGGAIMTNSSKYHSTCVRFHNLGMNRKIGSDPRKTNEPVGTYAIMSRGFNYRMSEIAASVAFAQLKKVKKIIKGCKKNWLLIKNKLQKFEKKKICKIKSLSKDCFPNYAFIGFERSRSISHNKFTKLLKKNKIEFSHVNLKDSHHFEVWKHFLKREKIKFIDKTDKNSRSNLSINYFCEINSGR